ncbi:hypothetical protein [Rhizobium leguminosarum]|uniref:Uncharacterized protein n=1 Tax=Rhizobium leguminosarum TaxID=384 RepID=A0A7K3VRK2_RHILE|nr:hypothetical protein [Rhizobium leguminosarum]NEK19835.1 hypothetical protein [Rhizobium leguminosarum]
MTASLIRKGEGTTIKTLPEKTDKVIRGWCKQYGIGRSKAWLANRNICAGFDDG